METKLSEDIQTLIQTKKLDHLVKAIILLQSDLLPTQVRRVVDDIRRITNATRIDVLEHSNTLSVTLPLKSMLIIAKLGEVFWVDIDHEAPLKNLIDSKDK